MQRRPHLVFLLLALALLVGRATLFAQAIPAGTYVSQVVTGDSITSGTVVLTGSSTLGLSSLNLGNSTALYWQQTGSLSGMTFTLGSSANLRVTGAGNSLNLNSSSVTMGSNAYLYVTGVNAALTLDATTAVTGDLSIYSDSSAGTAITNAGTLTHTGGSGSLYAASFTNAGSIQANAGTLVLNNNGAGYSAVNSGTVTADGSGTTVYVRGNFDNNGTLTAQNNGILRWDGTNTTDNLGSVVLTSGGRALLNGTINNTGTISAPTGGTFELFGGTISGGTIASGALSFTTSGGYLSGTTLTGDLNLSTTSSYVRFTNNATFTGTNATIANSAGVYWQQSGTLANKTITLGTGAYLYVNGVNSSLSLDAGTTVTGDVSIYSDSSAGTAITNAGTLTHTGGSGAIYAETFTNTGSIQANAGTLVLNNNGAGYSAVNSGTVTADGSGTTVYLRGNFDNNGTLTAQNNGILRWDGTNTTDNLGSVVLTSGGRALLNGTINNTGTISAPTGGTFELFGGTISGGTIASGALSFTTSGGYLSGTTLTGDLNLATASSYVRFTNNTTFTGANATIANSAGVYWQQSGTLANKTITLGTGAYLYVNGVNSSLSLDAGTTVTGDVSIYSDSSAGTAITNAGTLTHTGGSGNIYAETFTNTGSIQANAGTLVLNNNGAGYSAVNSGTVTADGSGTTVYVRGNFDNNGTLTAQNNGILRWDGTNTTDNLGSVVLTSGGRALLNGTINNTGTISAPTGGTFELFGGTISGGTIASGALSFTTSGGYLSGTTLTGDLNLATASSYVRFTNNTAFTGANATIANSAGVYWQQVGTLAGKAFNLGSGAFLYVSGINSALTVGATTTVTGDVSIYSDSSAGTAITNAGTLTHTGGSGNIYAETFTNTGSIQANAGTLVLNSNGAGYSAVNSGTVTADGSGTTVYLRGNFDNNGTLTAQNNGILRWDGTNTTDNLGSVVLASGGRALLNGTINNTGTISAPTGGTFELFGGTISGGTIATGAVSFTTSGGYLSATTVTGDLNLATASSYVRLTNNATFTGANASFANNAGVYWQQVGTLVGKAINLGTGAYLYVSGANNALTLDATTTVTGDISLYSDGSTNTAITNQGTITHTGGSGDIYASTFTNAGTITATAGNLYLNYPSAGYNAVNTGTVTADGSGTTVLLRGNFDNNGTVTAQNNGILRWDGTNSADNLGSVVLASGGRAQLNGTVNNAGTLTAPTGGSFDLYGGTIIGGSIDAGALAYTSSGGYLNGATVLGDINLAVNNAYVRLTGGASFTGQNLTLATSAGLDWRQSGTFTSKTVSMGNGSYLYVNGPGGGLTLDAATTVTGDITIYTDGNVGASIVNQGAITHSVGSGSIYGRDVVNEGLIHVTGGSLSLGTTTAGYLASNAATGTVHVQGGSLSIYGPTGSPFLNQGWINVQSGTLYTGNYLVNGVGSRISGSGTINGDLTLAGGELAPGNSIGTLTLVSSDYVVTAASVFEVELDATSADRITFQNPTSTIDLGAGLLSLSLQLLSAPTNNMTYTIMNISAGGSGFTGYFAGLPNTGDAITANFAGNPYSFNVQYLANQITLQAVPEPGTYALMGGGLALLGLLRRRARRT